MLENTALAPRNSHGHTGGALCGGTALAGRYRRGLRPSSYYPRSGHTDAQGIGRIACKSLLVHTTSRHVHLPAWFVNLAIEADGESANYLFDICAAIIDDCFIIALNQTSARSCVLCSDNQAALAVLAKGSTSSELGTVLVGGVLGMRFPFPGSLVARMCPHQIQRCG